MEKPMPVYQAIVTKHLPITNTKGARIKAIASAGEITISTSRFNGDNDQPAIERDDEQHRAVAKMLMEKYGWTGPLHTGRLPNGDYVHVMTK